MLWSNRPAVNQAEVAVEVAQLVVLFSFTWVLHNFLSVLTYRFCNNYADWGRRLKSVETPYLQGGEVIVKPKIIDYFGSIYKSMERTY